MNKKHLGIIGEGQLARMTALACHDMGVRVTCFGKKKSPAGIVSETFGGSLSEFLQMLTHVTIESEFVSWKEIQENLSPTCKLFPNLESIQKLQNKFSQKKILAALNIPTAKFVDQTLRNSDDFDSWSKKCDEQFGPQFIVKYATNGYDGKGVYVHDRDMNLFRSFCSSATEKKIELYCEQEIYYVHELAMSASRSESGAIVFYPLVISEQQKAMCDLVYGPATAFGISEEFTAQAQQILKKLGDHLNMTGTFAIEFFLTAQQELLVNEIAPRVHNSAHYSMNGCATSQFTNHVRAGLGFTLGSTESVPCFAMANLIGMSYQPQTVDSQSVCHWYGKDEVRDGRKMGHLNTWRRDVSQKREMITQIKQTRDIWRQAHEKI